MKYVIFSVILFPAIVFAADFQNISDKDSNLKSGLVYGKDHSFFIDNPEGWILDNTQGKEFGLLAVLYPKGSSFKSAESVMYENIATKSPERGNNIEEIMRLDKLKFQKGKPEMRVSVGNDIVTQDKKNAKVLIFSRDNLGIQTNEAVAYIDETKIVVLLVLSSQSEMSFKKAYPDFQKLVSSYGFFTDQVQFSKENKNSKPIK